MKKIKRAWYSVTAKGDTATIYLFDEIGDWGITASDFQSEFNEIPDAVTDIDLHINSIGGSVSDGLAIYNTLRNTDKNITVFIDGLAASISSLIAMAGDLIVMPENAMMMIHNPRVGAFGEVSDMEKARESLISAKNAMISAYTRKSGKTQAEISDIMDKETWFSGEEAVKEGFADVAEKPIDLVARISEFENSKLESLGEKAKEILRFDLQKKESKMNKSKKESESQAVNSASFDFSTALAQAKAEFVKEEENRKKGIKAAFAGIEDRFSGELNAMLSDMSVTVEQAKDKVVSLLKADAPAPISAKIVADERDKFLEGAAKALAGKAGIEALDRKNEFLSMSMQEMARAALVKSGKQVAGHDRMALVGAALTTSDFGNVLSDVANKAMLKGYSEAEETFTQFTSVGSLPDFKGAERVDIGVFPSLPRVDEHAEYKNLKLSDRGETIRLATYGGLFSISRQAIINDDLGVFTRIPRKMGRAAIRTIGDLVFSQLTDNVTMSDGKALFSSAHKNVANGAMETAFIDKLRQLIALQKEGETPLGITPKILLVPTSLRGQAMQIIESEFEVTAAKDSTSVNYMRGLLTVIDDARLDGGADLFVYELADPNITDTIEVAYLDGQQTPYLEQQDAWSLDGAEFKVRIDAGVKALDYRGMARGKIA